METSHSGILLDYFNGLYQRNILADIEFCCQDGVISAHRLVLAAYSDIVNDLIMDCGDTNPDPALISLQMEDCTVYTVKMLLDFLYSGESHVDLTIDIMERILSVSQSLKMDNANSYFQSKLATLVELGGSVMTESLETEVTTLPEKANGEELKLETTSEQVTVGDDSTNLNSLVSEEAQVEDLPVQVLAMDPRKTFSHQICCTLCDVVLEPENAGSHQCKMNAETSIVYAEVENEVVQNLKQDEDDCQQATESVAATFPVSKQEDMEATYVTENNPESGDFNMNATDQVSNMDKGTTITQPTENIKLKDLNAGYTRLRVYRTSAKSTDSNEDIVIEVVGSSKKKYKCAICNYSTDKQRYLSDHVRNIHPNTPTLCPICKKHVPRRGFQQHKRKCGAVSSIESFAHEKLECGELGCSFIGDGEDELKKHYTEKHSSCSSQQCESCGKLFSNSQLLLRHMAVVHHDAHMYKCQICEYRGSNRYNLLNHMRGIHCMELDGKPYQRKWKCGKCDFAALFKSTLEVHMRKHMKVKPFKCKLCEYTTDRKDSLTKHLNGYHKMRQPHQCSHCNRTFTSDTGWRRHCLREHSDVRPYRCDKCDMGFVEMRTYRQHMASKHMSKKEFQCSYCDWCSKTSKALKQHLMSVHQVTKHKGSPNSHKGISVGTTHYKFRFKELSDNRYLYGGELGNETALDAGHIEGESQLVAFPEAATPPSHQGDIADDIQEEDQSTFVDQKALEASEVLARIGEMVEISSTLGHEDASSN